MIKIHKVTPSNNFKFHEIVKTSNQRENFGVLHKINFDLKRLNNEE